MLPGQDSNLCKPIKAPTLTAFRSDQLSYRGIFLKFRWDSNPHFHPVTFLMLRRHGRYRTIYFLIATLSDHLNLSERVKQYLYAWSDSNRHRLPRGSMFLRHRCFTVSPQAYVLNCKILLLFLIYFYFSCYRIYPTVLLNQSSFLIFRIMK